MFIGFTNKEILTIKLPADVFSDTSYPDGDGVYLVYDGIAYIISVVTCGTISTLSIPEGFVPLEKRPKGKIILDRLDAIDAAIQSKSVDNKLEEIVKYLSALDTKTTQATTGVSLTEITNLVAVSQDASLIKNI